MLAPRAHLRQRGFGMVEIMVGLLIGLIAVLVVYQVYNVSEGFKRNTTALGEAQQSGLFSTFVLGMEIANAGAGTAVSASFLASCADTGNIATSFRPIPVLITDGGGGTVNPNPDSFVVNYSVASTMAATAPITNVSAAQYQVQTPTGIHPGDLVVGIPSTGGCGSSKVAPAGVGPPDGNGVVLVDVIGGTVAGAAQLFNLGPADRVQKIRYTLANQVCADVSHCNYTLYSTPLLDSNGAPAALPGKPLASNIVNMKIEYGIANAGDPNGLLATWVQATAGNGFDPATLLPAPFNTINRIKAIRIGLIVQSEQFDRTLADYTSGPYSGGTYNWVMFDCPAHDATCPGRLTGTIPPTANPAGNWRYRVYETVIPLRNEIWNLTP